MCYIVCYSFCLQLWGLYFKPKRLPYCSTVFSTLGSVRKHTSKILLTFIKPLSFICFKLYADRTGLYQAVFHVWPQAVNVCYASKGKRSWAITDLSSVKKAALVGKGGQIFNLFHSVTYAKAVYEGLWATVYKRNCVACASPSS